MAKPLVYPDFAVDDFIDPVSGQNNVVEPSSGKKSAGWARFEIPPRQHMNWIHRTTAEWVRWLEEITDANELRLDDIETVLASAASLATPDTLVMRDAAGRFRAVSPSDVSDVAIKSYVDDRVFEAGVRAVFYQSAAPSGWSIVAGTNDRALIAVTSGGGTLDGSWAISGLSADGTALIFNNLPAFGVNIPRWTGSGSAGVLTLGFSSTTTNVTIKGTASTPHTHGVSSSGVWRPAHAKVIICQRNA